MFAVIPSFTSYTSGLNPTVTSEENEKTHFLFDEAVISSNVQDTIHDDIAQSDHF